MLKTSSTSYAQESLKPKVGFTDADLQQFMENGITAEQVLAQIESIVQGFPYAKLLRPCRPGDGMAVLSQRECERLKTIYSEAAAAGRAMKFVPASGAASRMFKFLHTIDSRYVRIDRSQIEEKAKNNDATHQAFLEWLCGLKKCAFYDDLKAALQKNGHNIDDLSDRGRYKEIVGHLLHEQGLNYANMPKALIKFHRHHDHARTPIEEHLVEAAHYVRDAEYIARVHFTISPQHYDAIKRHVETAKERYMHEDLRYAITFSTQKASTNTIALDMENKPIRDHAGKLLFRPGGHGALLENLNDLQADIVFIKNIDNVVPDNRKNDTYIYKHALGGFLVELQRDVFDYLNRLTAPAVDKQLLQQAYDFLQTRLAIHSPQSWANLTNREKRDFLIARLNRPLRVCGMVKNEGEPGGGPFWVQSADGMLSLQIIEQSQVDMRQKMQKEIWHASTHFNPVDLVCGVRDYMGRPFNLADFSDPNTGFVSNKSQDGQDIKALELPGLWNGAMAKWNTAFVEVPISTFNPVKTVLDLLRDEHQG